jgi:hypothetical protein
MSKEIHVTTQRFREPTLGVSSMVTEFVAQQSWHAVKPMTEAELEFEMVRILTQARENGFVVTVDNVGDPAGGMGAYTPHVLIRPDYATVRFTMDEIQRRKVSPPVLQALSEHDPKSDVARHVPDRSLPCHINDPGGFRAAVNGPDPRFAHLLDIPESNLVTDGLVTKRQVVIDTDTFGDNFKVSNPAVDKKSNT